MLRHLHIVNFKAFLDATIELRPLTLLAGMNGMGKSTVMQVLLLLRQNAWLEALEAARLDLQPNGWFDPPSAAPTLEINGEYVHLGTAFDLFARDAQTDELEFHLLGDGSDIEDFGIPSELGAKFVFVYNVSENSLRLSPKSHYLTHVDERTVDTSLDSLFSSNNFQYINADRLSPQTTFELNNSMVRRHQLGVRGEYTAHFLHYWGGLSGQNPIVVKDVLKHHSTDSDFIDAQVSAWMSEISPGTKIEIQPIEGTDFIRLRFGHNASDFFRPTNVGFGLTYTLPIVTALVAAQPGSLILLENPEGHLHPYGQMQIADLIARAVAVGAQVILETHSDHIVNGIRIAVKSKEEESGQLRAEDVIFHFFQRTAEGEMQIVSPTVDADGRFESQTPIHFFDEYRRSMRKLL